MADPRYVVTTFRIPKEVHKRAKKYVKEFNRTVHWDEKKLSLTVLTGNALSVYMDIHLLTEGVIKNKPKTYHYQKKTNKKAG